MNKSKDVQMWVALNNHGDEIFIENAVIGVDYICPNCGGIVRARALDSTCVTEHFYHLQKSDCEGESLLHNYWKHNLIHIGDVITLPVVGDVECIDRRVEFSFNTRTGVYQPDLIIKTDNPKYRFIIFEIFNTNKKEIEKYTPKWKELKYVVFEVDVKGLHKNKDNITNQLKLLYSNEKEVFVYKSKYKINQLYNLLSIKFKIKDASKDRIEEIPEHIQEYIDIGILTKEDFLKTIKGDTMYRLKYNKYDVEPILLKFKSIFENNLNNLSKAKLNTLNNMLHKKHWSKDTYKDLISPLLLLHKELQIYT